MAIQTLRSFIRGDRGQDLVEFTMLLAAVGLMAAATILGVGNTVTALFSIAGDRYENASNGTIGTVGAGSGGGSTGDTGTGGGTGTGGDTGTGTGTGSGGNGNGNGGSGNGNGKGNK